MAKVKEKNRLPEIAKELREVSQAEIKAGVFNPGSLEFAIAAAHEYGTNIGVTQKMRGWFLAQGYPLTAATTHIRIPERSFIRSTFDSETDEIEKQMRRAVGMMIDGNWDSRNTARTIGAYVADRIKRRIESQFVMRTGDLRDSVQYQVN